MSDDNWTEQEAADACHGWRAVTVAGLYIAAFVLLALASGQRNPLAIHPWYMPPAASLVLILICGARFAPALIISAVVAAFAISFLPAAAWPTMLVDACLIAAGYTAGGLTLRHFFRITPSLRRTRDLVALLGVALAAPFFVASLVLGFLTVIGLFPRLGYSARVFQWWIGDAIGIIILAPVLLRVVIPVLMAAARRRPAQLSDIIPWENTRWQYLLLEAVGWVAILAVVAWLDFASPLTPLRLGYAYVLLLVWPALRHGLTGASLALLSLAIAAQVVAGGLQETAVISQQIFLLTVGTAVLLLGATVDEREIAERARQRNEEYFRLVTETGGDAIITIDETDRIRFANTAALQLFGYTRDELLGQPTTILMPERYHDRHRCALANYLATGHRHVNWQNIEYAGRRRDGHEIPLEANYGEFTQDGHHFFVAFLRDITERKAADRAKDAFLAALSHELRTPLTNIIGWAREAQDAPELAPEALAIIARNAEVQHRLLEDLLDVSRLLHGKLVLATQPTDLWRITEQAIGEVQQRVREQGLTLQVVPPATPLPMMGDPRRLREAVSHLLDNAIKFTDPRGTITITGQRDGQCGRLIIHDTGHGIPADILPTLFQPFRQVERAEEAGGLGLGLMLTRGIIELHGGRVTAESPGPGQGSTFEIAIPLQQA